MKPLLDKLENLAMAASFAEAGEWEFAKKLAGHTDFGWTTKIKSGLAHLERVFAAAAFAEENCSDICLSMLDTDRKNQKSLKQFLTDIGLTNVPVRYGVGLV